MATVGTDTAPAMPLINYKLSYVATVFVKKKKRLLRPDISMRV